MVEASADDIARVLDALHAAASKADASTYWSLFDPGAVFLGTDATERWTLEAFKAFAKPYFEKGQGWTYRVTDRHIAIHDDGRMAWFDEMLVNEKYGVCRGSGALVRTTSRVPLCEGFKIGESGDTCVRWRIVQYNLSVPIPNDLLPEVAERIRVFEGQRK